MAPAIYVREKDKERVTRIINSFDLDYSLEKDFSNKTALEGFDYIPSINLYVAREKKFKGKNWFESQKLLQEGGEKMLTPYEFIEYLKYMKVNNTEGYDEITQVSNLLRAEWLDADFKVKKGILHINYNHFLDSNGILIPKNSEPLDKNTLMKDKTPGISLEDYLNNSHTFQGLPSVNVKNGNFYYWFPRDDDNSVARFDAYSGWAGLYCYRYPSDTYSDFGVRAAEAVKVGIARWQ
ncbi:hypothetical protein COU58_02890 [Candidatus Pacearchaeota archaeon CG10_big_fil_rev_8_21_14_0_10_32_42]|nr:MAG: hypothetical protein COU58_02890 [Candidatus Pacearchaeota archaeon CG10_big_fil_rev_8_21_14_0_10_32_42]